MDMLAHLEFGRRRVHLQLQTEAAECGLACLAMIAGWHGHRIDMSTLRSRCSLSLKGANLAQLVQCAEALQLSSRAVRLELEELRELRRPCILHWDLNHFVVLVRVRGRACIIHDPAIGVRHLALVEVSRHFTGVALELAPSIQFEPKNESRRLSVRALMGETHGLWPALATIFVMAAALELCALAGPIFNQWVLDEVLSSADRGLLGVLACGFALMLTVQTCLSLARGWTVLYIATHLNLQLVAKVFGHLLHLPVTWFEKRHLGDVVSRFSSTTAIQNTLTHGFIEAMLDGIMAVVTLAVMFAYSAKLAGIVLCSAVMYALVRTVSYGPLREAREEMLVLEARERSCFIESMRGIQAIKLFARELDRRSRWLNCMVDAINRGVRTEKFMLWFGVAATAIFGVERLLVFWLGAAAVMDGAFTIGMLFSFISFGSQFSGRAGALVNRYFEFRMLSLHAERLADIVLEPAESSAEPREFPQDLSSTIELIDAGFRYSDSEPWIFRHLNLKVEQGESVVITGPSGCGKTTLMKLILGLLPMTEGEIRIGGVPVVRLGLQCYRRVVAAVMQEDALLAGSLAENISFFDSHADQSRVEECARLAAIHDDICCMPMGYHTLTGDMGGALSGGQKQRLLLARALYKAPRILVLDEATSHLDIAREREVNAAIGLLPITRICVAHRPETIAMAGRVIELGAEVLRLS